jgi:hypothetical protein
MFLEGLKDFFKTLCGEKETVPPKKMEGGINTYRSQPVGSDTPIKESDFKFVCTLTDDDRKSAEEIQKIKKKTFRRASRHFEVEARSSGDRDKGLEVVHRVVNKSPNHIEFEFFRSPDKSNSVKVRWDKRV